MRHNLHIAKFTLVNVSFDKYVQSCSQQNNKDIEHFLLFSWSFLCPFGSQSPVHIPSPITMDLFSVLIVLSFVECDVHGSYGMEVFMSGFGDSSLLLSVLLFLSG